VPAWGEFPILLAAALLTGGTALCSPTLVSLAVSLLGDARSGGRLFVASFVLGAWVLHLVAPSVAATAIQPANPFSRFSAKVGSVTDGDTVDVLGPSGLSPPQFASRPSTPWNLIRRLEGNQPSISLN
jgi:hypothetical protein